MVRTRRIMYQHHEIQTKNNYNIPLRQHIMRVPWMYNIMMIERHQCTTKRILIAMGITMFALLVVTMGSVRKEEMTIEATETKINEIQEEATPIKLPDMDGCIVGPTTVLESPQSNTNKPFWVPSYPASDNGLFAALVIGLTGNIGSNAKNYYASSPALKKCFNRNGHYSMTITCQQLHPIVGIGPLPETQADKFQPQIIMPIRNPMTCVPEHYQQKAYVYHNAQGQVSIDEWRAFRDEWLTRTIISEWKNVITTWKDMKEYDGIGLFVPFEHLMDIDRGPIIVDELASLLRNAGFPVVSSDDVKCVWYKVTKDHFQRANDESVNRKLPPQLILQYPFAIDYIPGYTAQQKEYMVTEMNELIQMYPYEDNLIGIVQEYMQQIRLSTTNDRPSNATNAGTVP